MSNFSLLSYKELRKLVEDGVITNVYPQMVNSTSIDLTLGQDIIIELIPSDDKKVIKLSTRDTFRQGKVQATPKNPYVMEPGEFILACTEQKFFLPNNISAEFSLKSSVGRSGLNHMLAGWCDPGWNDSVLTLELHNCLRYHHTEIAQGDFIGQVKFFRHEEVAVENSYAKRGRYNGDSSVSGIKL